MDWWVHIVKELLNRKIIHDSVILTQIDSTCLSENCPGTRHVLEMIDNRIVHSPHAGNTLL